MIPHDHNSPACSLAFLYISLSHSCGDILVVPSNCLSLSWKEVYNKTCWGWLSNSFSPTSEGSLCFLALLDDCHVLLRGPEALGAALSHFSLSPGICNLLDHSPLRLQLDCRRGKWSHFSFLLGIFDLLDCARRGRWWHFVFVFIFILVFLSFTLFMLILAAFCLESCCVQVEEAPHIPAAILSHGPYLLIHQPFQICCESNAHIRTIRAIGSSPKIDGYHYCTIPCFSSGKGHQVLGSEVVLQCFSCAWPDRW